MSNRTIANVLACSIDGCRQATRQVVLSQSADEDDARCLLDAIVFLQRTVSELEWLAATLPPSVASMPTGDEGHVLTAEEAPHS